MNLIGLKATLPFINFARAGEITQLCNEREKSHYHKNKRFKKKRYLNNNSSRNKNRFHSNESGERAHLHYLKLVYL